jgi:radical SAM superfamily enzyme YgiQ (UPF0313 family)
MGLLRKRPSLLLVNPAPRHRHFWDMHELCHALGRKASVHPLALPVLAALTPSHWQIRIVDEQFETVPRRARPDLVGITGLVSTATRAYELADHFRARGVPVVMGGPHISTNVEQALEHCDSVVIGEAELVWEQCLADAQAGRLQRTYRADEPFDFSRKVLPRWDLVDTSQVVACGVEVSRGCPHKCDFCLVRKLWGLRQRYRKVDDVVAEIQALPTKRVNFVDDNLTANKQMTRELLERLVPLGISWSCQAGLEVAYDKELLELAARSGCESMLIGFESLRPEGLAEACKKHNQIERYEEAIANVHAAGIHIVGSFIVGFDTDTLDVIDEIHEFGQRNKLSHVMINTLIAHPGSDLYARMKAEGRLTRPPPEVAAGIYPSHRFKRMSQADMFAKLLSTLELSYSYESLCARVPELLSNGAFTRSNDVDVSVLHRIRSSMAILSRHLITTDPYKRKFLGEIIDLLRHKRAAPGAIVPYVLMLMSVQGYLQAVRRDAGEIIEQLRENEAGLGPVA